jgi:hypothetical protein
MTSVESSSATLENNNGRNQGFPALTRKIPGFFTFKHSQLLFKNNRQQNALYGYSFLILINDC